MVLALLWAVLFADAWRLGAPRLQTGGAQRATAVLSVLLVLLTAGPLLFAAKQASAGRALISTVFGGNKHSAAVAGRYNVLLLGGDAGSDREGLRPDSMTLVSIDADSGRTVMFSFPRNMQNVPFPVSSPMHRVFPNGYDCGDSCLLNAVYTYASTHKGLYPSTVKDPGAQATMDAVSAITGLKVNYYALIDLKGFQGLIDAVGGITVDVKQRVPIGGETTPISGYIKTRHPAPQRLPRALVRALPHRVERLRPHGAPALRDDRDAAAAEPGDRAAEVQRDRVRVQQGDQHQHPGGGPGHVRRPGHQGQVAEGHQRAVRAAAGGAQAPRLRRDQGPGGRRHRHRGEAAGHGLPHRCAVRHLACEQRHRQQREQATSGATSGEVDAKAVCSAA